MSVPFTQATVFDNSALPRGNRNILPVYCHCRHLSANGCSAAAGRSGPPPGCISNGTGVPLSTRLRWISTSSAIGISPPPEKTEFNDPDWTVGVKLGHDRSGGYWPLDMVAGNVKSGEAHGMRTCSAFSKAPQISPMAMRSTPAAAPWKCSTRTRRKAAQASDCLIRTPFCGIRLDALCA